MESDTVLRVVYLSTGEPDFVNKYCVGFSANREVVILKDLDGNEHQLSWDSISGLSVATIKIEDVDLFSGD